MEKNHEKIFANGITLVALAISVSMLAFVSEEMEITGFAVNENANMDLAGNGLPIYEDAGSLATLPAGNYYINDEGVVYWLDDSSRPAVAKVSAASESQKNRQIYIDAEGNVGYILIPMEFN